MTVKKSRPKRVKMGITCVDTYPRWGNSAIVFKEHQGEDLHEVAATIVIKDPWDLAYIREQLDKIEAYWRKSLEAKP